MAASAAYPKAAIHTRMASLPSGSHPLFVTAEENLQRLKSPQGASSSSQASICQQLDGLRDLYECLDDVLQMPLSQQISHERRIEEVLDGSIRLWDMCCAIRDCFSQMKEGVKGLESSLRRKRSAESGLEDDVKEYMISKKNLYKMVYKCFRDLKRTQKNCTTVNKDSELEPLFSLLREIQQISFTVMETSLSFISQPKARSKSSSWSLVSKLLQTKKVSCEEASINEVEKIDSELMLLSNKKINFSPLQNVLKQVEALELSIEELEEGMEAIFRLLLKTRVSLLNIVN